MKKIIGFIAMVTMALLSGCGEKEAGQAAAVITEYTSEPAGLCFTLSEDWNVVRGTELKNERSDGSALQHDLLASHNLTGSSISIVYEDLTLTRGGTMVRIEDYVAALQEGLKTAEDYSYSCTDIEVGMLYGEEYYSFVAKESKLESRQYFYVRRIEDVMVVLIFTVYGEDTVEMLYGYGRQS